jgi:putative MATE family efflux protein
MALETAFNFINGYWVGKLGTQALAAVNLSSFSLWMMMALTGTISTGVNAVIAQHVGAQRSEEARSTAALGVGLSLIWGLVIVFLTQLYCQDYVAWQAGQGGDLAEVRPLAITYLRTIFCFAPIFCLNEVLSAVLRAHGDTRTPLRFYAFGLGLNFLLDPLLMFGFKQGLQGAAYASGLSFAIMAICFLITVRNKLGRTLGGDALRVLRIGFPSALTGAFFCLIYILISPLVAGFGPSALAALGVGHRVESFSYLVSHGLALASITLVGQHLGAGQNQRAYQAAKEACRLVSLYMLGSSLLMLALAPQLASIFSDDPEVLQRATFYLRCMSVAQWTTGLSVVLEGVMAGAGRPTWAMLASTSSAALRWPTAHWASGHIGLAGIWWALVLCRWIEALGCGVVFLKSSVWKELPAQPEPAAEVSLLERA